MSEKFTLVKWDEIERQIEVERDIQTLSKLHAALASKQFRKQIDGSIRAINKCEKYKIKIEIAFGDYYKQLESKSGKRTDLVKSPNEVPPKQQARHEIGKSRPVIRQYVKASEIENRDEQLEQYEAHCNENQEEMSSVGFLRFVNREHKRKEREQHREKIRAERKSQPFPDRTFEILYADPPWKYRFTETESRAIENQYPTMSLDEIKALHIPAEKDAVLFLWATAPKLAEAIEVLLAWGFDYRTCAVWDKEIIGMGYWFRVQHELLLIGVRGNFPAPRPPQRYPSVIREKRGKHSRKPEIVYTMIETMFPDSDYLELFARENNRKNWYAWGNE